MSTDSILGAVESFNRGDLDSYAAAFHPDATRRIPGVPGMIPASAALDILRGMRQSFTGLRLDPVLIVESGNHVVARWRTTGIHTGAFYGIAPTNRPIETESCEIYELRDGLVIHSWAFGDPGDVAAQLTSDVAP